MKKLKSILIVLALLMATGASAQCTFRNTAFKGGETLTYNLYYNWKFIWAKAGNATWHTIATHYRGRNAYRAALIARGNRRLDKYFLLRDTLLCYNSTSMEPLYYRKGAHEGSRYTVDEVFYSYPNGKTHIRQHRRDNDGIHHYENHTYNDCVYDMLSIFMRARSFRPQTWKHGQVTRFPIVDGNDRDPAMIVYRGKKNVKADNGHRYRCLLLDYREFEKGEWNTVASLYVTDDLNHIPIRLDMHLRFGSAKAFLVMMKGVRSKVTSLIR